MPSSLASAGSAQFLNIVWGNGAGRIPHLPSSKSVSPLDRLGRRRYPSGCKQNQVGLRGGAYKFSALSVCAMAQLFFYPCPVRDRTGRRRHGGRRWEQQPLQRRIVEALGQGPAKARLRARWR